MGPEAHDDGEPQGSAGPLEPERAYGPPPEWRPEPRDRMVTGIGRIFAGPNGLRAGWSVLMFALLWELLSMLAGSVLVTFDAARPQGAWSPHDLLFGELTALIGLAGAVALMAAVEQRRLTDYNLGGPRRTRHFFAGLAVGIAGLSLLVGELASGGWMHIGGPALAPGVLLGYALFWGCFFLIVGFVEEGSFRCYLQYTLTRGLNFWWALAAVAFLCLDLAVKARTKLDILSVISLHAFRTSASGAAAYGVYAIAALGLLPCFWLWARRVQGNAFWQAAWVTSTGFGFLHTGNGGENWVGIFTAAAIGFVFCASIRVTGSAWWAIGCHAGWDWAETYFYGTADSGLASPGHLLRSAPAGNPLWSGGADGPEGSVLAIGVLVLLLVYLLAVYGRRSDARPAPPAEPAPQ